MGKTWIETVKEHKDKKNDALVVFYWHAKEIDGVVWFVGKDGYKIKYTDYMDLYEQGEVHTIEHRSLLA